MPQFLSELDIESQVKGNKKVFPSCLTPRPCPCPTLWESTKESRSCFRLSNAVSVRPPSVWLRHVLCFTLAEVFRFPMKLIEMWDCLWRKWHFILRSPWVFNSKFAPSAKVNFFCWSFPFLETVFGNLDIWDQLYLKLTNFHIKLHPAMQGCNSWYDKY